MGILWIREICDMLVSLFDSVIFYIYVIRLVKWLVNILGY